MNFAQTLRIKYPDRIPVHIISDIPMSKTKFLIPSAMTLGQFLFHIRKLANIDLKSSEGTFVLMGNPPDQVMVTASRTFNTLDSEFRGEDSVLKMYLHKEKIFGGQRSRR